MSVPMLGVSIQSAALDLVSPLPTRDIHSRLVIKRISDFILAAEEMYGSRDRSFTFLGIELTPEILPRRGNKKVIQGRTCPALDRKHIYIQIRDDLTVGADYFVLAHECIHLLAPSQISTRNIEEGLADVFADTMLEREAKLPNFRGRPRTAEHQNYNAAAEDVRTLLSLYPAAIKELRAVEPCFGHLRPMHFMQFGRIDAALIERMLTPFPY